MLYIEKATHKRVILPKMHTLLASTATGVKTKSRVLHIYLYFMLAHKMFKVTKFIVETVKSTYIILVA